MTDLKYPPCLNPNCSNGGKSHPNCRCWGDYTESQMAAKGFKESGSTKTQVPYIGAYADGGEVHYCSMMKPHQESCEYFADGGQVEANQEFLSNPPLAVDHAIAHHGLLHALTKTGHSRSDNEQKPTEDFVDASKRGRKSVSNHMEHHFDKKHENVESNPHEVEALKNHLDSIRENPSQLLDVGGNLNLPDHQAALGAKAATAYNYLSSLKPSQAQSSPLDEPMPVDKMSEAHYNRQLSVAQSPLAILGRIKNGSVQPDDLQTLKTLYPHLAQSIQSKAGESLIDAKTKDTEIPYKHKMGLSMLLGQPLDSTMTLDAMQAIIHSAPGIPESEQAPLGKKEGATAQTQKTISKVDDLYKTPLEDIQTDKRA